MSDAQVTAGDVPQFEMRHRLGLALEARRIPVGEMAEHLGVSRNTIGNYLAGRTTPQRAVLRVWALRCGVPFEWLKDGVEEPIDGPPDGTSQYAPRDSNPEPAD